MSDDVDIKIQGLFLDRNMEDGNGYSKSKTCFGRYFSLDSLVEVRLKAPRDFLRIKETLTRMGDQKEGNTIEQVCYIFFKQNKYFIVHIKELQMLDGQTGVVIDEEDIAKRNLIVNLLCEWNLLEVADPNSIRFPVASLQKVRVIKHKDKDSWQRVSRYDIGKKKLSE